LLNDTILLQLTTIGLNNPNNTIYQLVKKYNCREIFLGGHNSQIRFCYTVIQERKNVGSYILRCNLLITQNKIKKLARLGKMHQNTYYFAR